MWFWQQKIKVRRLITLINYLAGTMYADLNLKMGGILCEKETEKKQRSIKSQRIANREIRGTNSPNGYLGLVSFRVAGILQGEIGGNKWRKNKMYFL